MEVYKYLPPKRKSFFENYKLVFTPPMGFNDPYECLPGISDTDYEDLVQQVMDSPEHQEIISRFDMNPEFKEVLLNELDKAKELKIEEYKRSDQVEEIFMRSYKKNVNSRVGILCLSRRNNSSLMWSHYTNGHKGFVVGFDSNHDFFKRQKDDPSDIGTLEEVKYSNRRIEVDIVNLKITSELFLVKNEVWKYEEEMRLVRNLNQSSEKIETNERQVFLFDIPKDSITSIVFGINSTNELREEILKNVNADVTIRNVKFYQAIMDYKSFDIQTIQID